MRDCCWICDGWQEIRIYWNNQKSGRVMKDPWFIHFNFNDYEPSLF